MAKKYPPLRFKTAGYSVTEDLSVSPGPSSCGDIHDGVTFWHDNQGAWVLDYSDLVRIVEAATAARAALKAKASARG